jgi:hypothetical protein
LKPERWGSLLVQETYQEEKACDKRHTHNNNNNILVKEQFGFRSKFSTEMATYNLISEILNALNNKNIITGVF